MLIKQPYEDAKTQQVFISRVLFFPQDLFSSLEAFGCGRLPSSLLKVHLGLLNLRILARGLTPQSLHHPPTLVQTE